MSQLSKDHHASRTSAVNPDAEGASARMGDTISETSSQKNNKQIEAFEIEKLSQKLIMMRPAHEAYEGNVLVQHNEAVYMVRKHIIEKAKLHWKEAAATNTN